MNIELAPGEQLTVTFKDGDGELQISYGPEALQVKTDWPDEAGRVGVIYQEPFGATAGDLDDMPVEQPSA